LAIGLGLQIACVTNQYCIALMLLHCWLSVRKRIHPVKDEML